MPNGDGKIKSMNDEYSKPFSSRDTNKEREVFRINSNLFLFILKQLLLSRLLLLIFQFFANRFVKDYPTDAFKGVSRTKLSASDDVVQFLFDGLSRWDAQQFLHIAEFGYVWDSSLVFFPLYPTVLRILSATLRSLPFVSLSFHSSALLGGVLLNNFLFIVNGFLLYQLVDRLTGSRKKSLLCVYIFCWSPISIFFSAVYTESLYFFFTLGGLLVLHTAPHEWSYQLLASFVFSFAFLTRSNGITNFGYIAFYVFVGVICKKSEEDNGKLAFETSVRHLASKLAIALPVLLGSLLIVCLPLRMFSFAIEEKFCFTKALPFSDARLADWSADHAAAIVLPGDLDNLEWCRTNKTSILLPAYYSHIQQKYWDVRLLGYWQVRKIPLFLLAAPSLAIVFYGVRRLLVVLLMGDDPLRLLPDRLSNPHLLVPFAVQSAVIALGGVFVYNVEVTTRLLFSASPYMYVLIVHRVDEQTPRVQTIADLTVPFLLPFFSIYARVRWSHFAVLSFLLGYFFVGTLLHVNWLPFV